MKTKTISAEAAMAMRPWRIESAPSDGPTVRSSSTVTGAGSAPARSTMARSRASSIVKVPVMTARPPGMRVLHAGALVEEPELEVRGLADEGLGPLGILQAGQLDQDAILSLPRDGGLGHAELVHPVADGLHALPDR